MEGEDHATALSEKETATATTLMARRTSHCAIRDDAAGSTIGEFLHTTTPLGFSPALDGDPRSQTLLAHVGNPASIQNSCRSSASERGGRRTVDDLGRTGSPSFMEDLAT